MMGLQWFSLDQLTTSVSNLWDEFGGTDNPLLGLGINLALALVGVGIWYVTTGWASYAGAVWAIINLSGIIAWVFGL